MKIDMYLPCMLQNKVCLEHMLKMAPSSIQAPLYASLQIGEEIAAITDVILARAFTNLQTRIQRCLDAGGGHFQHML
jgi:hypothetical protein